MPVPKHKVLRADGKRYHQRRLVAIGRLTKWMTEQEYYVFTHPEQYYEDHLGRKVHTSVPHQRELD